MNTITKVIDTLTGKTLKDAAEENAKTAADLKEELRKVREKIDAERTAAEREAAKGGK